MRINRCKFTYLMMAMGMIAYGILLFMAGVYAHILGAYGRQIELARIGLAIWLISPLLLIVHMLALLTYPDD